MKLTLKTIAFVFVMGLLFACSKNPEKLIVGTWENSETQVSKLDQVAEALFNGNKSYLEMQKQFYETQMTTANDSTKLLYTNIIASIDDQLKNLNLDTIKKNIVQNYKIGTFTFNADSSLVIRSQNDSVVGTWGIKISNDSTILNLNIQSNDIPLEITDISKSELIISQKSNIDTLEFDIIYSFKRKE